MVPRRLPAPTSEYFHPSDRSIAGTRSSSTSRHRGRFRRRNHHGRASGTGHVIERDGVVRRIRGHARNVPAHLLDQTDAGPRIIGRWLRDRLSDDDASSVNTEMELLPATLSTLPVFRRSPLALTDDRQAGAIDDEVKRPLHRGETEGEIEVLTPPRERRVIGCIEIDVHQGEDRTEEALGLAQWQPKDEPQRHGCLDREIRELPRSARSTGRHRSPRLNRVGGEPECHVTPLDESLLVLGPIPDAVFVLVLGMHARIHGRILCQLPSTTPLKPRAPLASKPRRLAPTPAQAPTNVLT